MYRRLVDRDVEWLHVKTGSRVICCSSGGRCSMTSLVLGMHSPVGLQDALALQSSSEFPTGSAERRHRRAAECQALCASVMFVNEANVKT
ncbi:hypothetical protein KRP22_011141 [Phytophthora ramorum]|uniref:uncharacterized protein n=1 Tax=Phytophthora ramorum TaxID=164328 RepID=UPI0030A1E7FA|nr:hypothetical protein KRP23_5072 [Phytophthora ramorum]KAH7504494.1 hypothetical protein KRP22_4984 [Phytophthora ramorum]